MYKCGRLGSNTAWEIQTYTSRRTYKLALDIEIRRKTDHAGLFVTVALWKFEMDISIYDTRHYDTEINTYK
jgi:hypothetical protein